MQSCQDCNAADGRKQVTSPRVDRGIGIGISTGLSAICISFVQNSIIFFIFIILYFMCFEGIRSMRNEDILSLP
jgi:hypothetical protein